MYEEYFGLKRPPFRITPDTSLFYNGGDRGDVLGALVYAVHRGEGIIKVVGEVGSGKTMLCRMLQQELPKSVDIIYIANPSVSPEDILFVIASELKFEIARDASKHEVVSMLHHYLLRKHAENKQVVLFVEEAQGMPIETLEEIRLLSNLETDQHKLLQIILFGQPELDYNLTDNSIRQLRERITHDFNLSPLNGADIHKYLNFRMREVGYTGPELINRKLADNMANYSEGLLRRINILADKMLLSAFAEGTHTLTPKHLLAAVNDSGFSRLKPSGRSGYRLMWLSGFLLLLLGTYILIQGQYFEKPPADLSNLNDTNEPLDVRGKADFQQEGSDADAIVSALLAADKMEIEAINADAYETANNFAPEIAGKTPGKQIASSPIEPIIEGLPVKKEMMTGSKKNEKSAVNLGIFPDNNMKPFQVDKKQSSGKAGLTKSYEHWLVAKIETSKRWLKNADKKGVSIQVMMRNKAGGRKLANYLRTEWPLDLEKTYLYKAKMNDKEIYRVFYDEYSSITTGQLKIKQLPASIQANLPYLHSIYRMQNALL